MWIAEMRRYVVSRCGRPLHFVAVAHRYHGLQHTFCAAACNWLSGCIAGSLSLKKVTQQAEHILNPTWLQTAGIC